MKPGDRIPVYVATKDNLLVTIKEGQCFLANPLDAINCHYSPILKTSIHGKRAKQIGTLIIKKVK